MRTTRTTQKSKAKVGEANLPGAGDNHLVRSESRAKNNEIVAPSHLGAFALKVF
jgi:hypothetical protein